MHKDKNDLYEKIVKLAVPHGTFEFSRNSEYLAKIKTFGNSDTCMKIQAFSVVPK